MVADDEIHWREELLEIAARLEAKTKLKRWTERTGILIERDFVVSAYAMRKLIELRSTPDELRQHEIPVRRFDRIGDSYDFDNGRRATLSVPDLCLEIMHSVEFMFCCGETADLFDGVYVSSDRRKNGNLHLVLASDYIALCSDVAV